MKAQAMTDSPILTKRMRLILRMAALTEADGIDHHTAMTAAQATVDAMSDDEVDEHLWETEHD